MDTLTFISELVDSLAWPVSIAVSIWVLREKIGGAIDKITKVKHKDTEISFAQELAEVKELDKKVVSGTEKVDEETLISFAPRGAILGAWLEVENSIREYAIRHHQPINPHSPPRRMLEELDFVGADSGANLGKGTMQMLMKLREIRNRAVHLTDHEITVADAKEYRKLANRVVERIEEA